jgi:4-amino-4-deoxy-L-arabinose transferase-like glycosyltransferase
MAEAELLNLILLPLVGLCFLCCLIFAARQVNPFRPPATRGERLRRAVIVGLLTGGGFLSLFLIIDLIFNSGFQWTIESLVLSWLCIILPFQILAMIGTYIEFAWQEKIRRHLVNLAGEPDKRPKTGEKSSSNQ